MGTSCAFVVADNGLIRNSPIMNDCHPVHAAISREVVGNGVMHSDAIVPHGQIPRLPAPSNLQLWSIHVIGEPSLEAVGLVRGQTFDVGDEGLIEIEERALGHRVVVDQRSDAMAKAAHGVIQALIGV